MYFSYQGAAAFGAVLTILAFTTLSPSSRQMQAASDKVEARLLSLEQEAVESRTRFKAIEAAAAQSTALAGAAQIDSVGVEVHLVQ